MHYFDGTITRAETLSWADALAAGLHRLGLRTNDRVALCLQNVPQFLIAILGCWRGGLTIVPVGPRPPHNQVKNSPLKIDNMPHLVDLAGKQQQQQQRWVSAPASSSSSK